MYHFCYMASRTIHFSASMDKFMQDYKEATGMSIQKFVTKATEELKMKIEAEQLIKDLPYNQK